MMLKKFTDLLVPARVREDQEYKSALVRLSLGVFMSIYIGGGTANSTPDVTDISNWTTNNVAYIQDAMIGTEHLCASRPVASTWLSFSNSAPRSSPLTW